MRIVTFITAFLMLAAACQSLAQSWRIHLNGNETFPLGNDRKGQYPILWYSSNQEKVLVGGFGVGVSYQKKRSEKLSLKFAASLQRSRFYDVPSIFVDENGNPFLGVIGVNTHYSFSLFSAPTLALLANEKLTAGAGLGIRGNALSRTDYGEWFVNGEKKSLKLKNKSLAPVVAFLPVEMTAHFGRVSIGGRLELSLSKVSRIKAFSGERSLLALVEVGYRLGT